MKFVPKLSKDNVNVTKTSHLKQFLFLLGALFGLVFIVIVILTLIADYLVSYIPRSTERALFKNVTFGLPAVTSQSNPSDQQVNRYVEQIVSKLSKHWQGEKQAFSIRVVHLDAPNAFVTPGGYIYVTSGLFKYVKSENGLAMVIGHEMAHQYKRHPLRSFSRGTIVLLTLAIVTGFEQSDSVSSLISNSAVLTLLKFSRDQESEADKIGQQLVKATYGHLNGTDEFFSSIVNIKSIDNKIPTFLKSHPDTKSRQQMLNHAIKNRSHQLIPLPEFLRTYRR